MPKAGVEELVQRLNYVLPDLHISSLGDWSGINISMSGYDKEWTGGQGEISAEALVEGLARYRELIGLGFFFRSDDVIRLWENNESLLGNYTVNLVVSQLSIALNHPLVGALHDLALASAPDPTGGSEEYVWTIHNPGTRFRRAVDYLAEKRSLLTVDPEDLPAVYSVAAEALGTSAEASRAYYEPDQQSWSPAELASAHELLFRGGFGVRAKLPQAIVTPEVLHDMAQYESLAEFSSTALDVLFPPVIVQPDSTKIRRSSGRDAGLVTLETTSALLLDDLQAGRGFDKSRFFLMGLEPGFRSGVIDLVERSLRSVLPELFCDQILRVIKDDLDDE